MENGYVEAADAAKRLGLSAAAIQMRCRTGNIKKFKKEPYKYGGFKWFIHESEIENWKSSKPKKSRGLYMTNAMKHSLNIVPTIAEPVDIGMDSLATYIPERGKFPYKNLVLAVVRANERKSWDEIEEETGVPKLVVLRLVDEYKKACKKEKKYEKSLMSYLNAGRPYSYQKKNLLKD